MENKRLFFSSNNHIGYIVLNWPEEGNKIDLLMAQGLAEVCREINQDDNIYVVVLRGSGDLFCLGGDILLWDKEDNGNILSKYSPAQAIASINCPTLAAINGDAIGEGLELALACDLRISSRKATFGLPQVSGGFLPIDGGTQRLSRLVGKAKALEMVLTGAIIDAQEAFEIGLLNKVVGSAILIEEVEAIAKTISSKAPLALRYCKEAVNKGMDLSLEQGLRLEADLYFLLHTTRDRTEGIQSFRAKRPPHYHGK